MAKLHPIDCLSNPIRAGTRDSITPGRNHAERLLLTADLPKVSLRNDSLRVLSEALPDGTDISTLDQIDVVIIRHRRPLPRLNTISPRGGRSNGFGVQIVLQNYFLQAKAGARWYIVATTQNDFGPRESYQLVTLR